MSKILLSIDVEDICTMIFYYRRYADNCRGFRPEKFNRFYLSLLLDHPQLFLHDVIDRSLKEEGKYWPFAQDSRDGYDARPQGWISILKAIHDTFKFDSKFSENLNWIKQIVKEKSC